jgi:hypothetical protein
MSELSKQALKVDNNQSFPNNNAGAITPSILRAFNVNMIDSNVNQTDFDTFSSSVANEFASLTASVDPSITGSSLITASFNNGTRNLTFTKGDSTTFAVNIPDVSGSTGNFATTGSNTFIGNQIISGNVLPQVDGQGDLGTDTFKWNTVVVNGQLKGSSINTTGRGTVGTLRVGDETFPLSFLADREIVGDGTGANTHMYYATSSTDVNGLREFVYAQSGSDADFTSVSASFNTRILASTIDTGSFATTGSNTFYGSQTISGSVLPLSNFGGNLGGSGQNWTNLYVNEIQGLSNLRVDAIKFNGVTLPLASIQPRQFFGNGIDASTAMYYCTSSSDINALRELAYVPSGSGTTANMNTLSASFASTIAGIVVGSGSAISVQDEGSILGNATSFNFNGAGVTATISAGTASITIPGGGGSIDTGSFATTGSNVFVGNQTIQNADLRMSGSIVFPNGANIGPNSVGQATVISSQTALQISSSVNSTYFASTLTLTSSTSTNINSVAVNTLNAPRTDIRGVETIGDMSGTSVGEVYLLARSGSLILCNSTQTPTYASLSHLSSSQINANTNLIFKTNTNAGSTIISGSNNIFTNPNTPTTGYIRYVGTNNNLYLNNANGVNTQITASAISVSGVRPVMNNNIFQGTANFVIDQAVNSSTAAYNINGNFFGGANATTINALAFTGSGFTMTDNLFKGGPVTINPASASLAEIAAGVSGSSAQGFEFFRNMTLGQGTIVINIGPKSATGFNSFGGNIINSAFTITNISSSAQVVASNNNVNGAQTYTNAGARDLGIHRQVGQMSNNFGGINLIASASAIAATANISTAAMTVTNRMYSGSVIGSGSLLYTNNINAGANNTYTITGSFGGTGFLGMSNNAVIGVSNTIFTNVEGRGNHVGFLSNVIGGQSLILTGSNSNAITASGGGYFGRFNADDGIRNQTAENIFFVGTGTSISNRKTGFLIDSGSNIYTEGTLNVSGSTTLSGSLYIQSASAFPTQIGTSLVTWDATTGQVGQATTSTLISSSFSAGEFYSMTTLSGSSGVSASIDLNNTAISNGVSIQNNSQITVQNTGVYNIQFSAQCDAFSGADTIWIWFKKNGTNITDSASKLIMQNNTAAIMTVNIFDNAVPNDYFEVVWQNNAGSARIISDAATGNIPGIPSIIVTVSQVK